MNSKKRYGKNEALPSLGNQDSSSQPITISIIEAAKLLGLHPNTVRKHVADGFIPAIRVGRRVLIPYMELSEYRFGKLSMVGDSSRVEEQSQEGRLNNMENCDE